MRVDVNLSVHREGEPYGERAEIKNLGSFRSVARAIEYERERQEREGITAPETRRFDEDKGITVFMRKKESAGQYRYFPEPNIPPVYITEDILKPIRASLPEFARERAERFEREYGISMADAQTLTAKREMAELFEETVRLSGDIKETKYLLLGELSYLLGKRGTDIEGLCLTAERLSPLVKALSEGRINRTSAKELLSVICTPEDIDLDDYITAHGYEQSGDEDIIRQAVQKIIAENPDTVAQFKAGKTKVFGFFVGQTMKALGGKADPELINKIILNEIKE